MNAKLVNKLTLWQNSFRWLLIGLSLLMLVFALNLINKGAHLDTNLRSLAPSFSKDVALNQALNQLSSNASQSVILVLADPDQDTVDQASELMQELIETATRANKNNLLGFNNSADVASTYQELLKNHAFYFLGDQAKAALVKQDEKQLNQLALSNLYGSASQIQLTDVSYDPFGFVNEYAVGLLNNLTANMQTESRLVQHQGQLIYIYPQLLQINTDGFSLDTQTIALQQIQQLKSQLLKEFPDLQIYESGMIFFAADSAQSAQADISLISIGSTIGVILLLLLVFRSIKAFLLPVISIGLGVLFAFLFCQTLFGSIHILTLVFGASLIGVVVDYSLHYFYFCVHQNAITNPQNLLIARSAFYRALLLSLLSSVVGYAALAASGLEALTQIAIFSASGLIFSWLFVVVCGQYLTRSVKVYDTILNSWITRVILSLQPVAKSGLLFSLVLVLMVYLAFSFTHLSVSDSPKALVNNNHTLMEREQLVSGWVSGYEPASFVVVSGESEQEVFDRIANLRNVLSKQSKIFPESTSLLGVDQLLPAPNIQQENYRLNQWLYHPDNQFAAQFIAQQEMGELVNLSELQQQLNNQQAASPADLFAAGSAMPSLWVQSSLDKTILSFMLIPKHAEIAELQKALQELEGVTYFSAVDETKAGLKHLRESALQYLLLALLFIAMLLLVQYRIKKSLYLIAIPIISLCGSLALLMLFNIPLSLFHVMALFLVLGLGIDYVVFVAEMTSANLENANDGDFFPAIVLSSVTNLLSFGLLALSSMPAVNAFGITLLFGCTLNLLGAIWLVAIWRKRFL